MAKKPVKKQEEAPKQLVDHGNAAILAVKFLDLILIELKKINKAIEESNG